VPGRSIRHRTLLIWTCGLADQDERAARVTLCSPAQKASLSLRFSVLLCCPTAQAQKAHEIGHEDFGVGGTEKGKQSHADSSFYKSDAQALPIFILPLSCFHRADTNPP